VFNTYGGNGWQVLMNDFYQGEIFYSDGGWRAQELRNLNKARNKRPV